MIDPHAARDEDTENMVRAAWYYFIGGLNQSEVADRLGLSRIKVNRLIAQARAEGHVSIRITHPSARILALEAAFADAFGLPFCRVVPSLDGKPDDVEEVAADRRAVAIAAADVLANEIARRPEGIFGIGWGNTIAEMVTQLIEVSAPQAKFVSVMGSLTRNAAANPFESVHRLAEKTSGEGYFLPAPYLADTVQDRQVFLGQRTVKDTLALAAQADLCVVGVTEVSPTSFLVTQKLITEAEHKDAERAGAVGSFTGLFFDANGRFVDCDVNERRIGLDPEALRTRRIIAVTSGAEKASAVRGALAGRFFAGMVLDEALARALVPDAAS
jgi:DNA-binding transcriptional regulator LsrR (DeoR family)